MNLTDNSYNLRARLQPTLIVVAPLFIVILLFYLDIEILPMSAISLLAALGSAWLMQLGREMGKRIEPSLFESWGGKPSVTIIRHRDNKLNPITKTRYHKFLEKNVPDFILPSREQEDDNPIAADLMYQTATDWLLSKTRDIETFRLLFEENMNYGFRRNLYALKPIALFIDVVLIIALVAVASIGRIILLDDDSQTLVNLDVDFGLVLGILTLHVLSIIFLVTKKWVRTTAEAYAFQLLAACDVMQ